MYIYQITSIITSVTVFSIILLAHILTFFRTKKLRKDLINNRHKLLSYIYIQNLKLQRSKALVCFFATLLQATLTICSIIHNIPHKVSALISNYAVCFKDPSLLSCVIFEFLWNLAGLIEFIHTLSHSYPKNFSFRRRMVWISTNIISLCFQHFIMPYYIFAMAFYEYNQTNFQTITLSFLKLALIITVMLHIFRFVFILDKNRFKISLSLSLLKKMHRISYAEYFNVKNIILTDKLDIYSPKMTIFYISAFMVTKIIIHTRSIEDMTEDEIIALFCYTLNYYKKSYMLKITLFLYLKLLLTVIIFFLLFKSNFIDQGGSMGIIWFYFRALFSPLNMLFDSFCLHFKKQFTKKSIKFSLTKTKSPALKSAFEKYKQNTLSNVSVSKLQTILLEDSYNLEDQIFYIQETLQKYKT